MNTPEENCQMVFLERSTPPFSLPLQVHAAKESVSSFMRENRCWEPLESEAFLSVVKDGDTVLDVGANIGYYTVLASNAVGADGSVVAFEPDPRNYRLLQSNVAMHRLSNVATQQAAVGEEDGEGSLHLSRDNFGDHRLSTLQLSANDPLVSVLSLAPYLKGTTGRTIIKIDTQGSEGKIMRGIADILARRNDSTLIFLEFWPSGLAEAGDSAESLLDLLETLGFDLLEINEARMFVSPVSINRLRSRLARDLSMEKRSFTNVLLFPHNADGNIANVRIRPLFLRALSGLHGDRAGGERAIRWSSSVLRFQFSPPVGGSTPVRISGKCLGFCDSVQIVAQSDRKNIRMELPVSSNSWNPFELPKMSVGSQGLDLSFTAGAEQDDLPAFALKDLAIIKESPRTD